jgi:tRNA (guanine37-N1)-methyltransferase
MLKFDIITIFPNIFDSYLKESFIRKAKDSRKILINIHNLRNFAEGKHKTIVETSLYLSLPRSIVDDRPYGGGLGMVLKIEPIYKAVKSLLKGKKKKIKRKIVLFTPRGKSFNQKIAYKFSKLDQLILICGRYEGVDERVAKYIADMEISIGPYDLMGGELPAMVVAEAVTRLIPGVLGKPKLLKERISKDKGFIEYPQYTRPAVFSPDRRKKWRVPKVLVSGHHKKITEWREKHGKIIG